MGVCAYCGLLLRLTPRAQLLATDTLLVGTYLVRQSKYKLPVVVWRGGASPSPARGFMLPTSRLELLLRYSEHVPDRVVRLSVRLFSLCQVLQRKNA